MPIRALYVLPIWILQGIEVMKEHRACKQRVLRCISTKLILLLERVRSTTTDIKGWKFYVKNDWELGTILLMSWEIIVNLTSMSCTCDL
jgi:hypothetical protein